MQILKFGGTSLENAKKFLLVSKIIRNKNHNDQTAIVLSAPATITNHLIDIIKTAIHQQDINPKINTIKNIYTTINTEINNYQNNFDYQNTYNIIEKQCSNLKKILYSVKLIKQCPKHIYAFLISRGEIFSIEIMKSILQAQQYNVTLINPTETLISTGDILNSTIDIVESTKNIQKIKIPSNHIILMPGFIAGNKKKELVVLGRNGSDYSAAILAACFNAKKLEIWTDVDGLYTCDPRIISNAHLIKIISYQEALELSYLGATVLHPKTILPIMNFNIPCHIKNTNNIHCIGTVINNTHDTTNKLNNIITTIKSITYINNIVMITIIRQNNKIYFSILKKILYALEHHNVWIISIIQSIESNLNFFIQEDKLSKTIEIVTQKLKSSISDNINQIVKITKNLSMISIIGKKITTHHNILSTIISVLEKNNVNIVSNTQSTSQNSLSIIINNEYTISSILAIHQKLFGNKKIAEIFLLGVGGVGKHLLKQIHYQKHYLAKKNIHLKICGIANSKQVLKNLNGIDLNTWKINLNSSNTKFNFENIKKSLKHHYTENPVIIDCTSSRSIAKQYIQFLSSGFHIVTSNKKANTHRYDYYQKIRNTALQYKKKFLYETNVGAGLPVIENLKNLLNSGDQLQYFRGILSGSLSFIFGELENDTSFSQATQKAQTLGFTEPDPRDDLSGIDVARKLLILARESGYEIELQDIKIESILPSYFNAIKDIPTAISELTQLDSMFSNKMKLAKKSGKVIRYIGMINSSGECQVKIEEVDQNDPLYTIKNGENALAFYSKYYQPIPLVLRGYGAGNNVTAAGIFADLLRTLS
ncbi:MAG: bifunctional aspartate kinase/homoserine dehydrogenase I [Buchnera aphidicola (Eriosoma harunire)]